MPIDEVFEHTPQKEGGGEAVSIRIVIEGRVQKVGLRNWIKQKAVALKISGWVRNRVNNTVEATFFGPEQDVRELVKICHQGPSFAYIKKIKEFPQTLLDDAPIEFCILPTI